MIRTKKIKFLFLLYGSTFLFMITDALQCMYYNSTLTILSHEFDLNKIKQKINSLELRDKYQTCVLTVAIDYRTQTFTIKLAHDNDQVTLVPNTEISLNTVIGIALNKVVQEPVYIMNMIVFQCEERDACDQRFIMDHLEWLFKVEYKN